MLFRSHGLVGEVLYIGDPVHGIAVDGDDGSLTLFALEQDLGLNRQGLLQALVGLAVLLQFNRFTMNGLMARNLPVAPSRAVI